ncbi:futalosine hydrolase [Neorhodopirellula lusitana]|uniref:Futalosine hydrolase n=1 Tax=Neorhodopirellula lusitana TaxID=445327 RepID=A0ABY1Q2J0_9BACT|nr:futalosine hydrolase [Neorhodopirellula lusitana]SMP56164.1 futalosine hydrolase [Neorhodopirellula lusitana]
MPKRLLLVPTSLERKRLLKRLDPNVLAGWEVRLCGFGVIAAATQTTRWIAQLQPGEVVLAGIAGSLHSDTSVGSAVWISETICEGIGVASQDGTCISAGELGWNQVELEEGSLAQAAINDRISLPSPAGINQKLLTVCAASGSPAVANARRQKHGPDVVAEDMEGFAVAMACRVAGVPLRIVRGISNVAGDRDSANWQIDNALDAVAKSLATL